MAYALGMLHRFGFMGPKQDTEEAFDNRLIRIRTREERRSARAAVFVKRVPSPPADAVHA